MTVRTRFAPSPTGSLHVGGARTALYCFLHARRHDGRFLLRIEDTDQRRSTAEAAHGILRDMQWLGLDWDEGPGKPDPEGTGPYFQSHRLEIYDRWFQHLLDAGKAYDAWDSPEELLALREQAREDKVNFHYRRRPVSDAQVEAWRAEGRVPVLRLVAPDHDVHMVDAVLGEVSVLAEELEDIVIRKADGFPTYHFGVVVDDHLMGVTLVLRGQEHLLNTPKHLGLYEAFGWDPPRHAHLPIIFNPGGGKMSKRDKARAARAVAREMAAEREAQGWGWLAEAIGHDEADVDAFMAKEHDGVALAEAIAQHLGAELPMIEVMDFRKGGYLPEALLNYLALLGWSTGDDREILTMDELVASFDLERVNHTAARFDPVKLHALAGEHMRRATLDRLLDAQDAYLEVVPGSPFAGLDRARRRVFLELYQQRMATFVDLDRQAAFFFARPTTWDDKAVQKHVRKGGGVDRLRILRDLLAAVHDWTPEGLRALDAWSEEHGVNMGKVAQPLRVAVTGAGVSPGIHETLAALGQEEVLARVDAFLAWLDATAG